MNYVCRFSLLTVVLAVSSLLAAEDPRRDPLLDVAQGELPSDTARDGASQFSLEDHRELGGKALKAVLAAGDSFGVRAARIKDWKSYSAIRFDAFHPGAKPASLTLNVIHARTKGYPTRVVREIALEPGLNRIQVPLETLLNTDGSAPDLSGIVRWYLAPQGEQPITLHFSSIWLEGGARSKPAETSSFLNPAREARLRDAKLPAIEKPILFHTAEADAILSALAVFPADNPSNLDVSRWPVHPDSRAILGSIGTERPMRCNYDMGFILVPSNQPRVPVKITDYPDESDKGPFPLPDETPIEGWPAAYQRDPALAKLTLEEVQRNKSRTPGDRHAIVIDPAAKKLYEFFIAERSDTGWQAAQASIFDLASNRQRPEGWTSGDAAGLPIFPAVVRYDELERGVIDHALRVTVPRSRKAYVYPATHHAGHADSPELPRMGERLRLRGDFDLSGFSPAARVILAALKKHGMLVADNGLAWSISIAPDPRIPDLHEELRKVKGSAFEVVAPPEGYRPPR